MFDSSIAWDELFESEMDDTTQNVGPIMDEYCAQIEKSSGGVVHARYEELMQGTRIVSGARNLIDIADAWTARKETYQVNALKQKDANELYDPKSFVFDVYNERYQFRLCELEYGAKYPIKIFVDKGIGDEIGNTLGAKFSGAGQKGRYLLSSDSELRSCFKCIIESEKSRFILNRLLRGQKAEQGSEHL